MSGQALVTGGGGFAGRHLVEELRSRGEDPVAPPRSELDLLDADAVREAVARLRPRAVFHLAAHASVPYSWAHPRRTLRENFEMTQNVLEAVQLEAPESVVVLAGSGEVYGAPERLPVDESAPLRPRNPYALSKAACDLLGAQFADVLGLNVVRMRSFNQAGPGQSDEYVLGTLTRQVAEAEAAGEQAAVIRLGNLDSARDFTDVRDVSRAYADAVSVPAGTYNVCSGRSVSVRELLELLRAAARIETRHEVAQERLRAGDVPDIRGSAERFARASGWQPRIPLEQTVADALDWWRGVRDERRAG
ncbi:MAG TPA: GDP-mannose 4,6-dehydratase [Thermoleophilaceae bacterium]|nr:GDP-mannose 4,6-dehydratase [Thermoleophilaceae bacterium]